MDQIVVEAPPDLSAAVGDVVHVFGGESGCGAPSVDEIAALAGTNSYEILVGISPRVPRVFVRGDEIVAVRNARTS
jgi:alanine racemase